MVRMLVLPVIMMGGWHYFQSDGGYSAMIQSRINDADLAARVNAPSAFEYYPVVSDTLPTYEHTPGTPEQEAEDRLSRAKALAESSERAQQAYEENIKKYCAGLLFRRNGKPTKTDRKWDPECFSDTPPKWYGADLYARDIARLTSEAEAYKAKAAGEKAQKAKLAAEQAEFLRHLDAETCRQAPTYCEDQGIKTQ